MQLMLDDLNFCLWPQPQVCIEKSRNGDTLGPVELIVWPEQANQGDQREQDDQVS